FSSCLCRDPETKDSREAATQPPSRSARSRRRAGNDAGDLPMANASWFDSAAAAKSPPVFRTRPPKQHRTIFISDTHLGTRGCKAEALADFLAHNDCDTLYMVGDIVDGWQMKRKWFWTDAQSQVVAQILRMVDAGTRVIFVPGNHDEFARDYAGRLF